MAHATLSASSARKTVRRSVLQLNTKSRQSDWFCPSVTRHPVGIVCVLHVSVLDVLPVHQHVLPAERPHLPPARQHAALKLLSAVPVDLRRRKAVDAVLREAGHRLSEGQGTGQRRRRRVRLMSPGDEKRGVF